jgi:hypothetical protein
MARKPLTEYLNRKGYFDGWKDPDMPEGWTHLPAAHLSAADNALNRLAESLKLPFARYLSYCEWRSDDTPYRHKFTGIVVPTEDAERVAALAERVIRGEVRIDATERLEGAD